MTPSFVRTLLTGTCAGMAFLALVLRVDWRRYWIVMGVAFSLSLGLLRLPYPEMWTVDVAIAREALVALLGAFLGMQLMKHDITTLIQVGIIGILGCIALQMPKDEHWAYRGLAFVCLAAAMVLRATWQEMDHLGSPLQRLVVQRLRYVLAVQAIYCESWEFGAQAAGWMATVACAAHCWLFFGITREALNGHANAPIRP